MTYAICNVCRGVSGLSTANYASALSPVLLDAVEIPACRLCAEPAGPLWGVLLIALGVVATLLCQAALAAFGCAL
ncbi:MAG: hypothetical protein ACREJC_03815 [Tepidisphaeraceae bacterium]